MKTRLNLVFLIAIVIISVISFAIMVNPVESQKINEFLLRNARFLPGRPVPADVSCQHQYEMSYSFLYCTKETDEAQIFIYLNGDRISYVHFYLKDSVSLGDFKQSLGLWQRHNRNGRNHYWHWNKLFVYSYSRSRVTLFTPIRSLTLTL